MTARGNLPHLLQAPRLSQSLPSDPTKFESDSVEGEEVKTLFDVLGSGAVEAEIGQRYPLSEAAEAHRALEARETTASTVLLA
jgi:NADPH:quinone reductase-like Zn-dependent oxidoreductase